MKNLALLFVMFLALAFNPLKGNAQDVDCVDCTQKKLVDESSLVEAKDRVRTISSIAEESVKFESKKEFPGFDAGASQLSRGMGRAPSVLNNEDTESFEIK